MLDKAFLSKDVEVGQVGLVPDPGKAHLVESSQKGRHLADAKNLVDQSVPGELSGAHDREGLAVGHPREDLGKGNRIVEDRPEACQESLTGAAMELWLLLLLLLRLWLEDLGARTRNGIGACLGTRTGGSVCRVLVVLLCRKRTAAKI